MNKKVLASLLVIGVVAAVAGGSTFALFNDSETSEDNTFAAGELDLQIDYKESYNGEFIEHQGLTDDPGAIFELSDIKPGDQGEATISMHVSDNPAFVNMDINQTSNAENGCSEPEAEVDDTCGNPGEGEGELGENMNFVIWHDDGDKVHQADEEVIYNGSAHGATTEDIQIDGNPATDEIEPVDPSTTEYVGFKWYVPRDVGNIIQTDSKQFDFTFTAEQSRHNGGNNTVPEVEEEQPVEENETENENDTYTPPVDNETDDNVTQPEEENETEENNTYTPPVDNETDDNETQTPVEENETSEETYWQVDFGGEPHTITPGEVHEDLYLAALEAKEGVPESEEPINPSTGPRSTPEGLKMTYDKFNLSEDEATIYFEIDEEHTPINLSMSSWEMPWEYPGWQDPKTANQTQFDQKTQTFTEGGQHSLTVNLP